MKTSKTFLWVIVGAALVLIGIMIGAVSANINTVASASPTFGDGETEIVVVNGLNTTALGGLVDMLKGNPDLGRVTFYSDTKWQDGMRSFTTFAGYTIDGQMLHESKRKFVLLGDEGVELSGTDAAPGAVEELMYAMGTCILAAGNANAALMGVKLTRFEIALETDLDLHGLFALDEKVRPGILDLRAKITIAGDANEETLKKIARLGYDYSPVSDSVRKGVSAKPEIVVVKD